MRAPEDDGMTAAEVGAVVDWLEGEGVVYQVNGGWAVDALVGHQTRTHRDLDVFVDESAVPRLLQWLAERGYAAEADELPARIELGHGRHRVDVHPMRLDEAGDGIQFGPGGGVAYVHRASERTIGTVGRRRLVVADADRLLALREGCEHRAVDVHDLRELRRVRSAAAGEGSVVA